MNTYIDANIKACIGYLQAFQQSVKMAAMKDDGKIDRNEEKVLKRLNKATEKYIRELDDLRD